MNHDLINGSFELVGGIIIFLNCFKLYQDKEVKGVSPLVVAFFFIWGIWNLFYYPALGQMWSFMGGLLIVSGNLLWVLMYLHYLGFYKKIKNAKSLYWKTSRSE